MAYHSTSVATDCVRAFAFSNDLYTRDYHVIMILVANSKEEAPTSDGVYVVDFDSALGKLSSWEGRNVCVLVVPCRPLRSYRTEYTSRTFKPELFKNATFDQGLQRRDEEIVVVSSSLT